MSVSLIAPEKAADTESSALLCKARRTPYGFRNAVVSFRLILYEYDQQPKLTINVLTRYLLVIKSQPQWSRCGKGLPAVVWLLAIDR